MSAETAAPPQFRFHHLGVVVPHVEQAERFVSFFGAKELWRGDAPKYEALCVFVAFAGIRIEFIVPTGERLKGFNKGRGGIHHVAVECDGPIDEVTKRLVDERGAVMLEEAAVAGASLLVNFLQPICTGGVLVEIVSKTGVARDL